MAEYIDKKKVIDIINITCPDFNIPEINDSWAHKLIVIIREALVELVEKEPAADVRENVYEYAYVECDICGARGKIQDRSVKYCATDEAAKARNRRAEDD